MKVGSRPRICETRNQVASAKDASFTSSRPYQFWSSVGFSMRSRGHTSRTLLQEPWETFPVSLQFDKPSVTAGFAVMRKSSADKVMRTPLSKQRNKHIQRVLV